MGQEAIHAPELRGLGTAGQRHVGRLHVSSLPLLLLLPLPVCLVGARSVGAIHGRRVVYDGRRRR